MTSSIDYDAKVQQALRQVVKDVLSEAASDGLPGDHHFYVAFKTQAEGVEIPTHLTSRFPDEMTIVIQHKFWGLQVKDTYFEIGLSFNQKPELLVIPYAAIVGFVDPSVQFALQFNDELETSADNDPIITEPLYVADNNSKTQPSQTDEKSETKEDATEPETGGDNIVTLDAFRRK